MYFFFIQKEAERLEFAELLTSAEEKLKKMEVTHKVGFFIFSVLKNAFLYKVYLNMCIYKSTE